MAKKWIKKGEKPKDEKGPSPRAVKAAARYAAPNTPGSSRKPMMPAAAMAHRPSPKEASRYGAKTVKRG